MKSSTERPVRRPDSSRSARSAKAKRYTKQTARVEARRDGKPLIFGWGKHLSHTEKVRIQTRVTWIIAGILGLIVVGVIVWFWLDINVIVPGETITSVNGHAIPQSQFRKLVAVKAQLEDNVINGPHGLNAQRTDLEKQVADQQKIIDTTTSQITSLTNQIKALPPGPSAQRDSLNAQLTAAKQQLKTAQTQHDQINQQLTTMTQTTIPLEQQRFTYTGQIGGESATWLQDDELIREWLATQSSALQAQINPTTAQINQALNDLKANMPSTTNYNKFLSQDNISNDDVLAMLTLKVRRDNMQNYLASLKVSPTYQVLARSMSIDTQAHAQKILQQLKQGSNFGALAKQNSLDTSTKNQGGYMGWLARGQLAESQLQAIVEDWIFDPHRTINEISPIIMENGDYHIVQILGIDFSRPVDSTTLKALKDNALSDWLLMIRGLPGTKVTPVDQNMQTDPMNQPPDLPSSAPALPSPTVPAGG
jgi:parvulin-like peptidyl-prolyl isomerase